MYGQGGGVTLGVTTTAAGAGVAVLPATGGNTVLSVIALTAVVLGGAATLLQLIVMGYRRRVMKGL